jgi:hypothetical protein
MYQSPSYPKIKENITLEDLYPRMKERLAAPKAGHETHTTGYGIEGGEKILLQVSTMYDPLVIEAFAKAARDLGATVDVIVVDGGPDRDLIETDELTDPALRFLKDYPPGTRMEGPIVGGTVYPWAIKLAEDEGYDRLIGAMGGPAPKTKGVEVQGLVFGHRELVVSDFWDFPLDLWGIIAEKSWRGIYEDGRGGKVELTDPEGTNVTFTLHEAWYSDGNPRLGWTPQPFMSHLMGHPPTPLIKENDLSGVVSGTINHTSSPFPNIEVTLENGKVVKIEGGGKYGELWNEYLEKTKDIQYPVFPDKGLFWLWEFAIGTNPKMFRLPNMFTKAKGGAVWERLKSGYIHVGIGTMPFGQEEFWAAEKGVPYGHLHVHLLFPTYKVHTTKGEEITVIDKGHLTALDDPEVRKVAEKYGDPDEVLREEWIPGIPGINMEGKYEDYAKAPFAWIKKHEV